MRTPLHCRWLYGFLGAIHNWSTYTEEGCRWWSNDQRGKSICGEIWLYIHNNNFWLLHWGSIARSLRLWRRSTYFRRHGGAINTLICCLRMTFPVLNDLLYETLYVVRFDYSSAATRFGYYVEWALHAVSVMGTQDKLPWTMLRWLIEHLKTCFISWSSPHKLILYDIVHKYRSCQ